MTTLALLLFRRQPCNNSKRPPETARHILYAGKTTDVKLRMVILSYVMNSVLPLPGGGGGGYSPEFLVGVCRPGLQIATLFQT